MPAHRFAQEYCCESCPATAVEAQQESELQEAARVALRSLRSCRAGDGRHSLVDLLDQVAEDIDQLAVKSGELVALRCAGEGLAARDAGREVGHARAPAVGA